MSRRGVEKQREVKARMKATGEEKAIKRKNRDMKALANFALDLPLKKGKHYMPEDITDLAQAKKLNCSVEMAIVLAQVLNAIDGDVKAAEFVRDTAGQKPTDKHEIEGAITYEDYVKARKVKL